MVYVYSADEHIDATSLRWSLSPVVLVTVVLSVRVWVLAGFPTEIMPRTVQPTLRVLHIVVVVVPDVHPSSGAWRRGEIGNVQ